ncbi:SH3 domain-containing kinase-binding protein 1 isoform X4 [Strongylocentrotus purpuratus]|uniref:SH3 domain-containing protein n=1 Tax=Strongylocentrotus purpuratus TaxID=7668 RepID=A0A7M7PFT6_STRPU|nr:SH3 domain-containing kinase-binding protein 1 isoform X4 [Strongylocentrotus purpuratus]
MIHLLCTGGLMDVMYTEAVVEFDYDAVNGDELTLHKGAIIKNINMMEGGWWEGEVHGKRGMFPDNFVKVIEKPSPASTQKPVVAAAPPASSTSSSLSSSSSMKSHGPGVANGDVSLGNTEMGDEAKVKKREGGSKKRKMRAKVTFSYSPQNEDELELVVNETVEVVDQPEEGWWEGVIKGKSGLFPSNFVTMVDEDDASEAKSEAVSSSGGTTPMEEENKPVRKIKSSGIGHGNIFAQGIPQLRKTPTTDKEPRTQAKAAESHPFALKRMSLRKKEHEEKKDEEKKEDKNASSAAEAKGIFKVKVIYDYEPKNGDELQLKKGEIVTVIDRDAGDSGWWKGEVNGKTGVFPDNFTEEISEEKSKKKNMPAPVPARPVSGLFRGSDDDHHTLSAPPRPSRPGSMEVKGGSTQKPGITKQPSQDSKLAPKENGSRHLPPGAKQVLPPPTAGRPHVFNKPTALTKPQVPASRPHDVKETSKDSTDSGKTDPKESTFDNITINTEKLTHINLSRPKATPNRRPPSTFGMPPPAASKSPPSSTSSSSPPNNTPPLAPRAKHKKPPHLSSTPLAPIPDHDPPSTPSNTSSLASSSKSEEPTPSAPVKSSSQAHPPAALPEKPKAHPPATLPEKPRPPAPDHLPPRPSTDPAPASKESHSSDPPWKTELKNRTNKSSGLSSASGAQSAENGSGPPSSVPPSRPKASSTTTPTPAPATDTSSAPPPPRPAVGVTKTTPSINSSAPKDGASSADVQELKKAIKSLHETIASIKTEFKKEVKKLMTEVDEEKKHRMMMQVELERIKKLVMEGD